MNYGGIVAGILAFACLLYAIVVVLANSGIFLKLGFPRRFSLRDMLIALTILAILLAWRVWLPF